MPYATFMVLNVICVLIGCFAALPRPVCEFRVNVPLLKQEVSCRDISLPATPLIPQGVLQKWNRLTAQEIISSANLRQSNEPSSMALPPGNHTTGHLHCPACEQARVRPLTTALLDSSTFRKASEEWIASRSFAGVRHRFIAPRTLQDEKQWIESLSKFFGELHLNQIHAGHIRSYQEQRARGELSNPNPRWKRPGVGPQKINQEVALLIRIMKKANCWTEELDNAYEPFQVLEHDIPRALTPQEQDRFLQVASSREEWRVVFWYATVGLRIGFSNEEMRGIRLGDFSLEQQVVTVQAAHAKRRNRIRTVPLTPDACWGLERLKERAKELGSTEPQHYLFPFGVKHDQYDPTRPMTVSGIKNAWQEVREAAGVPWFRQHDVRHTAITRWAESGMSIAIVMSLAGHLTQKMLMHYTHISGQAARLAMEQAYGKRPQSFQQPTYLWKSAKRI